MPECSRLCKAILERKRKVGQELAVPNSTCIAFFHNLPRNGKNVFNLFCHTASGVPLSKQLSCSFCAITNSFFND